MILRTKQLLQSIREVAVQENKLPPDSRIVIEADGIYLEQIDSSSFCCRTSLTERIRLDYED